MSDDTINDNAAEQEPTDDWLDPALDANPVAWLMDDAAGKPRQRGDRPGRGRVGAGSVPKLESRRRDGGNGVGPAHAEARQRSGALSPPGARRHRADAHRRSRSSRASEKRAKAVRETVERTAKEMGMAYEALRKKYDTGAAISWEELQPSYRSRLLSKVPRLQHGAGGTEIVSSKVPATPAGADVREAGMLLVSRLAKDLADIVHNCSNTPPITCKFSELNLGLGYQVHQGVACIATASLRSRYAEILWDVLLLMRLFDAPGLVRPSGSRRLTLQLFSATPP